MAFFHYPSGVVKLHLGEILSDNNQISSSTARAEALKKMNARVDPFFLSCFEAITLLDITKTTMIDFKDAVNLATNKDLWRNFSSISNPQVSVAICSVLIWQS